MDVFKFHNPVNDTRFEQGEIINGIKSKMWVERYRENSEFTFVADIDTGLREKLPIGSLISHVDSTEVMIVENHEINDSKDEPTEISITGRGFETFLENRIVGSNRTFPSVFAQIDYSLGEYSTWNQAVMLIQDHILASNLLDDDNALSYIAVLSEILIPGTGIARTIPRASVYQRLLELLEIDDLGIKIVRPGVWSTHSPDLAMIIHYGINRTSQIIYSYDSGDIESADYFWTNQRLKNAALITGRWVETWVDQAPTNYDRRVMYIDANDIDNAYDAAPVDPDFSAIVAAMQQRGIDILASQNNVGLANARISQDANQALYRADFNVGDFITVQGNYNEQSAMRIIEYVEIEDETGSSGYPTLAMI